MRHDSTPPDQPKIDPSLQVQCDLLPGTDQWKEKLAADGSMSMGNFTILYSELQNMYTVCAIRHDCLIEATKGNSKTAKSEKCITNNKEVK